MFNLQDPLMHIDPRDEPSGSKSGKNKRKLDFWYMPYRIYVHLHTCASGWDSFGYMYIWIVLDIYVLLDTCTVGDMYFWIYIYFLIHVHWHFTYKWMIYFTSYEFFGFHMLLCQSIVWIIYYLWMHYVKVLARVIKSN